MYGSVVVGTKGQIVIPSDVRRDLSIGAGDTLFVITKWGKAVGLIKTEDLDEFMDYMKQEMQVLREIGARANEEIAFIENMKNLKK